MIKYLLFLLPLLALIVLIGFIWYNQVLTISIPKDYAPPADTVSYISYTKAADMNGSELNLSLRRISDTNALLNCSYRKAANKRRRDFSRRVSAGVLDQIMEIVDQQGMADWLDLPKREAYVLDEASQTLRYRINRTNYVVSSLCQMPDDGEGFRRTVAILNDLAASLFRLS